MVCVVQRVTGAAVISDGVETGRIGRGLCVLVGFHEGEDDRAPEALADKLAHLRIFEDENGKIGRSVLDIGGGVLAVPNFTLCASLAKGRRPSFERAMRPERSGPMFDRFIDALRAHVPCGSGVFGSDMRVTIENDGPVTLVVTEADLKLTSA